VARGEGWAHRENGIPVIDGGVVSADPLGGLQGRGFMGLGHF